MFRVKIKYLKNPIVWMIGILLSLTLYAELSVDYKAKMFQTEFSSLINSKQEYILIDTRGNFDYNNGHIEGAISLPKDSLVLNQYIRQNKTSLFNKKIIIYCETGRNSHRIANKFAHNGYDEVYSLIGGFSMFKKDQENIDFIIK